MRKLLLPLLAAVAIVLPGSRAEAQAARPTASFISGPEAGDPAPDFSLPWASKDTTSAADFSYTLRRDRGRIVVLAFYPADFTPSDTRLLQTLAARSGELFGDGVTVLGISTDKLETHRKFARSLDLPFRLLSDPTQKVARLYGSSGSGGRTRRTVYVLAADGTVQYRDLQFDVQDSRAYDRLKRAVERARAGGAERRADR